MKIIKLLKENLFGGSPLAEMASYAEGTWPFFTAQIVVRVYYFFLLYSSVILFQRWDLGIAPETQISFIPTIAWIPLVGFPFALSLIKISFIAASLLASLVPQSRWVRILSFITILQFVSLYYSVLQLDVDWYTLVLTSFFLIFLPDNWRNPRSFPQIERQKFLLVFWSVQAINLLTYSMSGIGKILAGISQSIAGQASILSPKAAALHAADRAIVTQSSAPLTGFVVDNYYIVWPFFLGDMYLLIFSIFIAFKPKLHRAWGLGLIIFHIMNYLVINIGFNAHIFLAALIFLLSPFAPQKVTLKEMIEDLPIIGIFAKVILSKW